MGRYFFFYGTLQPASARGVAADLLRHFEPIGQASVRGRIFARIDAGGAYPVLVPGGLKRVAGTLFRTRRAIGSAWLRELDCYEDEGGEYRRRRLKVSLKSGRILKAEVYVFNRALGISMVPIPHGDFIRWLEETGAAPLGAAKRLPFARLRPNGPAFTDT